MKFRQCRGWKLFKWGKTQVELWFCPPHGRINPHYHSQINSTIVTLFGTCHGTIGNQSGPVGWLDALRGFCIPAGRTHCAVAGRWGWLFLNIEEWSRTPTSAALDFHEC